MVLSFALAAALQSGPIVIENVSVVEPGKTAITANQTVVIVDGVFTVVSPSKGFRVPDGARKVDGSGKFLIPGLWDMHVHWYDEKSLDLFTANGVTGIRIMYGMPMHKTWREKGIGPRMVIASPIVDGPKPIWTGSLALKSAEEAEPAVKKIKEGGWDFVKAYSLLPYDTYLALAKAAKQHNIPIEGHVPASISVLEAARLGQRSNEHMGGFLTDLNSRESILRPKLRAALLTENPREELGKVWAGEKDEAPDPKAIDQLAIGLAKTGMWQCPTLVVIRSLANLDKESFTNDPRLKYIAPAMETVWLPKNDFRLKNKTANDWEADRVSYARKMSLVKPLKKAGSRFLAGTDCLNPFCFPGFSLHDELGLLVEAGLTPTEALEAATINPARYWGEDKKWGLIAKGMRADAVLLDGNPLVDIANTKAIASVIQGGKLFTREDCDAMLKANERKAGTAGPLPCAHDH